MGANCLPVRTFVFLSVPVGLEARTLINLAPGGLFCIFIIPEPLPVTLNGETRVKVP